MDLRLFSLLLYDAINCKSVKNQHVTQFEHLKWRINFRLIVVKCNLSCFFCHQQSDFLLSLIPKQKMTIITKSDSARGSLYHIKFGKKGKEKEKEAEEDMHKDMS